mmetsp:Transcript_31671/g.46187  ORF Transcript_31671/g.46187 Transcript_31671/m.46187 type:complete len:124 (+) Transcript_31671:1233-1604(+)
MSQKGYRGEAFGRALSVSSKNTNSSLLCNKLLKQVLYQLHTTYSYYASRRRRPLVSDTEYTSNLQMDNIYHQQKKSCVNYRYTKDNLSGSSGTNMRGPRIEITEILMALTQSTLKDFTNLHKM